MKQNIYWTAGLNNGESFSETSQRFQELNTSPWLQLQDYLITNNLVITSLFLSSKKTNRHWNLPSSGKNPKISFFNQKKPERYNYFRTTSIVIYTNTKSNNFTVIAAEYENVIIEIWVDENENSWINQRNK